MEVLGTFNFEIQHRPGKQHGNADGFRRIPCKQCGRTDVENEGVKSVANVVLAESPVGRTMGWCADQHPSIGIASQTVEFDDVTM